MEVLMRTMFQSLGKNHSMNKLAKKYGLRMGQLVLLLETQPNQQFKYPRSLTIVEKLLHSII